jgi:hypothetical protein
MRRIQCLQSAFNLALNGTAAMHGHVNSRCSRMHPHPPPSMMGIRGCFGVLGLVLVLLLVLGPLVLPTR